MNDDSSLEFEILIDSVGKRVDTIEETADVLQALGRWLAHKGHPEGWKIANLSEELEESVRYKVDIDSDADELTKRLLENYPRLEPYVAEAVAVFWCLLDESTDRPKVRAALEAISALENKDGDAESASLALKLRQVVMNE